MNKFGLIVTINKYKHYFSSVQSYIVCNDMNEAKLELIKYLTSHFSLLNIDFPTSFEDFENIWFNQTYVNADVFTYKIFSNNDWLSPWSNDEIYDDVLEAMLIHENKNPPDFSELYGEPTQDMMEENEPSKQDYDPVFTTPIQEARGIESQIMKILEEAKTMEL
jgi:hypothetical protein